MSTMLRSTISEFLNLKEADRRQRFLVTEEKRQKVRVWTIPEVRIEDDFNRVVVTENGSIQVDGLELVFTFQKKPVLGKVRILNGAAHYCIMGMTEYSQMHDDLRCYVGTPAKAFGQYCVRHTLGVDKCKGAQPFGHRGSDVLQAVLRERYSAVLARKGLLLSARNPDVQSVTIDICRHVEDTLKYLIQESPSTKRQRYSSSSPSLEMLGPRLAPSMYPMNKEEAPQTDRHSAGDGGEKEVHDDVWFNKFCLPLCQDDTDTTELRLVEDYSST